MIRPPKRQLIEAIIGPEKLEGISREHAICLVTKTMRVLERIWRDCGGDVVWVSIRSIDDQLPAPFPDERVSLRSICKSIESKEIAKKGPLRGAVSYKVNRKAFDDVPKK